ncbi:hypothetical protein QUF88_14740 [Bacillus sp. DX1.1]|uniref:hypothetical protein n=1 Tax=unclassified Bacillus (in: firmicutes) TaxID=185979 RepID=UPI002570128E|nr:MULTISPECIES: hypothetical protein [unclassified Bacillus (in: firmicutes)]MDM5155027.1 hypothetical protein [Bacillus sp. DX1.1]WJE83887.1 hypothetical protein QRE67_12235 [Bacillus sp. DX3.1]
MSFRNLVEMAERYFEKAYKVKWKAQENSHVIELAKQNGISIENLEQLKVIV